MNMTDPFSNNFGKGLFTASTSKDQENIAREKEIDEKIEECRYFYYRYNMYYFTYVKVKLIKSSKLSISCRELLGELLLDLQIKKDKLLEDLVSKFLLAIQKKTDQDWKSVMIQKYFDGTLDTKKIVEKRKHKESVEEQAKAMGLGKWRKSYADEFKDERLQYMSNHERKIELIQEEIQKYKSNLEKVKVMFLDSVKVTESGNC